MWPIFDAERGNYRIAATGTGSAGTPYLAALKAFSTPQGFIPEQIFNSSVTLPGDADNPSGFAVTTPAGDSPGAITGSMEPLNWAQGEYITLLANIAAGKVIDIPQAVCARYFACVLTPGPGQVEININVNAMTQWGQYVYVTGNTDRSATGTPTLVFLSPCELSDLEKRGQPRHQQRRPIQILPQESGRQRDLGMLPGSGNCNGNRSLAAPSSGSFDVNDTVSWN